MNKLTNSPTSKPLWQKLILVSFGLGITLGLIRLSLPTLISQTLVFTLAQQGATQVQVGSVSLDLLQGQVAVHQLQFQVKQQAPFYLKTLAWEIDYAPLWQAPVRLHIKNLTLSDSHANIRLSDKQLWLNGLALLPETSPATQATNSQKPPPFIHWSLAQFELKNIQLNLDLQTATMPPIKQALSIHQLSLNHLSSLAPNALSQLSSHIIFNQPNQSAHLTSHLSLAPLASKPVAQGQIQLNGLDLKVVEPLLPNLLNINSSPKLAGLVNISLNFAPPNEPNTPNTSNATKQPQINGSVSLHHFALHQFDLTPQIRLDQLGIQLAQSKFTLSDNFNLVLSQFQVNQLSLNQQSLGQLAFDQLTISPNHIAVSKVALNTLKLNMHFDDQNQLTDFKVQASNAPQAIVSPAKAAQSNTPSLAFHLTEGMVFEGNNVIQFSHPQFDAGQAQTLTFNQFSLGPINTETPQARSDIDFSGKLNAFSHIQLTGQASWLQPRWHTQLNLAVKDLDLTPFSQVIEGAIEQSVVQGNLSAKSQIEIQQSKLNSQNHLTLKHLKLASQTEAVQKPNTTLADNDEMRDDTLDSQLQTAPAATFSLMNYSLNVLRDKQNQIQLSLPITGNLDEPNFHFNDVFNHALKKSLNLGTRQLIMMALQPYSNAISLAELTYDFVTKIRLTPIEFAPGLVQIAPQNSATNGPEQPHTYLQKIAALMQQHPALNLSLCANTTLADQALLKQSLAQNTPATAPTEHSNPIWVQANHTLAKQRQLAIKSQLIELGVASERLILCTPSDMQPTEQLANIELTF